MQIQHIFFDLDHTLWDFDTNSAFAIEQTLQDFVIDIPFDDFHKVYNPINERYWSLYTGGGISKEDLKRNRFKDAFNAFNYKIEQDKIEALSKHYMSLLPTYKHLHTGAIELLEALYPHYKLHIITNGFSAVSHKKLQNSGIKGYFEQIVTSECTHAKKPDPIVFQYALDLAKAEPEQSVMVGDNYQADVLGAEAVGIKAVWFDYKKRGDFNHKRTITSLIDFKPMFRQLN